MGHFSMEIDAPTGSNLSGNQQIDFKKRAKAFTVVVSGEEPFAAQTIPDMQAHREIAHREVGLGCNILTHQLAQNINQDSLSKSSYSGISNPALASPVKASLVS